MKLSEYFEHNQLKIRTFARYADLHPVTVRDALLGYEINYSSMEKIIKATHGKVKFEDLKPTNSRTRKTKSKSAKDLPDNETTIGNNKKEENINSHS